MIDITTTNLAKIQAKTVRTLALGQALGGFGFGSTLSVGAIMATELSGSAAFSGAAATLSTLGSAFAAIPLANIAARRGRRYALGLGAGLAILGAIGMITAAALRSFPVELIALFFLGSANAVSLQARFAAADIPTSRPKAKDISIVVWATTFGAVIGPNLIAPGESLGVTLGLPHLAGPFLLTILAQTLSTTVFWFGLKPDPLLLAQKIDSEKRALQRRKFREAIPIVRQKPIAAFAVISIALSHMVMVSVMSMTPAHLSITGHSLSDVGFTISLHVAGMYALSPIFGLISDRFGARKTIILGQLILLASLAVSGFGANNFSMVVLGLFLLGLGWSSATVAGSALLSESLDISEKPVVQGLSDSLMNLSGAFGGAISGTILILFGFAGLNAAALLPVILIVFATAYSRRWQ
ncbi:MAG: MFS transporter [Aquiluna sp.]